MSRAIHELFGIAPPSAALGFPRPASRHAAAGLASLRLSPVQGGDGVDLLLPHAAVCAIADRALGGTAGLAETTGAGAPHLAELGVLAYACARLAAAAEAGWVVSDVALAASDFAAGSVHLPIALASELGPLALGAVGRPEILWPSPLSTELVLADDTPLPALLRPGDVALASGASLALLSGGLCGELIVRVAGLADELVARTENGVIRGTSLRRKRVRAAELTIATRRLALGALAELVHGGAAWPIDGGEIARLRRAGAPIAEGELVWLRGELGLRITRMLG